MEIHVSEQLQRALESFPPGQRAQMGRAFRRMNSGAYQEAFGRDHFDSLILNVAHQESMRGYGNIETIWPKLCVRGTAANFKTKYKSTGGDFTDFAEVKEFGEYPKDRFTDEKASYSVSKYGKMLEISMEAELDDELGEFSRDSLKLGRSAANTQERFVLKTNLESDPTIYDGKALFHADHNNSTGSGGYTLANLKAAIALFMKHHSRGRSSTSGDESEIMIIPRYLLVPPDDYQDALRDVNSRELMVASQASGTTTFVGTSNPIKETNFIRGVLTSPMLTTGASYLMADPNEFDTFQIDFLRGRAEPEIFLEPANTGRSFTHDSRRTKGRTVFGGTWLDYRTVCRIGA